MDCQERERLLKLRGRLHLGLSIPSASSSEHNIGELQLAFEYIIRNYGRPVSQF